MTILSISKNLPCFDTANLAFVNLKEKKSSTFFSARKLPCYWCVCACVRVCTHACVSLRYCLLFLNVHFVTSYNSVKQEQSGAHPSLWASSTFGERQLRRGIRQTTWPSCLLALWAGGWALTSKLHKAKWYQEQTCVIRHRPEDCTLL